MQQCRQLLQGLSLVLCLLTQGSLAGATSQNLSHLETPIPQSPRQIWLTANGTLNPGGSPPGLPGTPQGGQLPPGGFEPLPQPIPGTIQPGGVNPLDPSSPRPIPGTPLSTKEPGKALLPPEQIRRLPPFVYSPCNSPKFNLVDGMALPPIKGNTYMQDILLQPPANIPPGFEVTTSGSLPVGANWASDGKQICIYNQVLGTISPSARSSQMTFSLVPKGGSPLSAVRFRVLLPVALGIHTLAFLGTTQFTLAAGRARPIALFASGDPVPPPTKTGPTFPGSVAPQPGVTPLGGVPSAPITWRYIPDTGQPGLPQGLQLMVGPDGNAGLQGTPPGCIVATTQGQLEITQRSQVVRRPMQLHVSPPLATFYELKQGSISSQGTNQPRFIPGQRASLVGRDFCPNDRVYINGQEAPNIRVVSATQIDFDMIRPTNLATPSSGALGEPVLIQVATSTSGLGAMWAGQLTVLLDTFKMVALGDSVMWGQGLEESQKFHTLVQLAIQAAFPNMSLTKSVYAHSGARICFYPEQEFESNTPPCHRSAPQANRISLPGEINIDRPIIWDQVLTHAETLASTDLILLDGCINDVDVFKIIIPDVSIPISFLEGATSVQDLAARTQDRCFTKMKDLLAYLIQHSPATIALTSYFPIVTQQTDLLFLANYLAGIGAVTPLVAAAAVGATTTAVVPAGIVVGALSTAALDELRRAIAERTVQFFNQSSAELLKAAREVDPAGQRILVINVPFQPINAVRGPSPWLFGIGQPPFFPPQDSIASLRASQCADAATRYPQEALDTFVCERASAGHPNVEGARQYADAIMNALRPRLSTLNKVFSTQ